MLDIPQLWTIVLIMTTQTIKLLTSADCVDFV